MSIKDLTSRWALPDRSDERMQITLRLGFNDYARLHALKELYPNRSVNDFLNDIVRAGLDEIVSALPIYTITPDDPSWDGDPEDIGRKHGPGVIFESAYRKIFEAKSTEESIKEAA